MANCKKCEQEKNESEFYPYQKTECKDCIKKRVRDREFGLRQNPEWKEKERKRGRDKYHRLYEGTGKANPKSNRKWIDKFPEKRKANVRAGGMLKKRPFENAQIHHWSYLEEHWKDILWLSLKAHNKAHRFLVYDSERKQYRRNDTLELLDTKERHEQFIREMILTKED